MPCILGCLALSAPRVVLILVFLFSDYLKTAYQTTLWPLLGFFFLPLTTLGYAFAIHQGGGKPSAIGWAAIALSFLIDLGLFGTSRRQQRKHSSAREIVVKGEKVG